MKNLVLRPYTQEDRSDCLRVFQSNIPAFFLRHETAEFEDFLDRFADRYFVVQTQAGNVVACGGLGFKIAGEARLCYGLVRHELHNEGLGRLLLLFRLSQVCAIPEIEFVTLDTTQHNAGFFERFGFVTEQITANFYGPAMHRHDMRLALDENARPEVRSDCAAVLKQMDVQVAVNRAARVSPAAALDQNGTEFFQGSRA